MMPTTTAPAEPPAIAMAELARMRQPQAPLTAGHTRRLLKLLTMLSPAFPVGSFAYSHGIEWLIASGVVTDQALMAEWLGDLLRVGGLWNDAVLFIEAYGAAEAGDAPRLSAVADLAGALAPSRERQLESSAQGSAFVYAVLPIWPHPTVELLSGRGAVAYPVAVGAVAAAHEIAPDAALAAFLNAGVASLVSVSVRLVPLGQSAGLAVLAGLHEAICATAGRAMRSSLDDLGSAAMLSDIASMRHETQYSRVFRT